MINYIIKSEKQFNGLYGTPLNCVHIDKPIFFKNKKLEKLHSAIVCAIGEHFNPKTFEIYFSTENGFCVRLNNGKWNGIIYKNYKLENNKLIYKNDFRNTTRNNT